MGPSGGRCLPCLLVPSEESKAQTCGHFRPLPLTYLAPLPPSLPPSAELMQTGRGGGLRGTAGSPPVPPTPPTPAAPGRKPPTGLWKRQAQLLLTGEAFRAGLSQGLLEKSVMKCSCELGFWVRKAISHLSSQQLSRKSGSCLLLRGLRSSALAAEAQAQEAASIALLSGAGGRARRERPRGAGEVGAGSSWPGCSVGSERCSSSRLNWPL